MNRFLPQPLFDKLQATFNHMPDDIAPAATGNQARHADSARKFLEVAESERELKPGEILFMQNDPAEYLYWIETGAVAVLQGNLEQEPRLLAFRYPGQVVGEIALIEDIDRTATIAAVLPTRLKSLSKDKFKAMLNLIPGIGVELLRLLSARLREIQPAEYSAGMYDHLTGALSRQAFDARLPEEIERAQLYRFNFSLIFIDLDGFKDINDSYGHTRGDEVLVNFVQRVSADLRTTDMLFRYGGDEFALLLQGIDQRRGVALVERLLDEFRNIPIPGDPPILLSFSAGIAYFPADGDSPETLLKAADERVYNSKRSGRGQVTDQDQ